MDNELQELLLLLSTLEGVGQLKVAVYNATAIIGATPVSTKSKNYL